MNYLNRKVKSIILSGLLSMGIVATNYMAFNKEVVLIVNGQEIEVSSSQPNVKGVLEENDIKYSTNDVISEDLYASLEDGMKIEIKKVEEKTITETSDIPYETVVKDDNSLDKGKTKVVQNGQMGTKEFVYKAIYEDGKLVSKKLVEEKITEEPTDKIVKKGTKEKEEKKVVNTSTTTNSQSSLGKKIVVQATAYSEDGITSTGTVPKWGTIAVDPTVIPYGTKVYIPQFDKYFIAEDCGGAIKGNRIDIFMNSESQCNSWGRRNIDIYIVK